MRQFSKSQRRLAAGAFLLIAAPIAATSVAYACQSLATLHADPGSAPAGTTIAVRGTNYSGSASAIEIRLDGRAGRLLTTIPARGTLNNEPVPIPADVAVGTHTLLALQYTASGNLVSGTPGRASLVVTGAARTSSEGSGAGAVSTASTDTAAADPVAATPADVTPAVQAPSAPATSGAAAAPQAAVAAAPATAAASGNIAAAPATADGTTPGGPAAPTAPAAAAAAAAAEPTASAAGPASVNVGLLPASASESSGTLPGLALAAGLALVLLALGAFIKTGRNLTGRSTPLAG